MGRSTSHQAPTTRASLLVRVRSRGDEGAWREFHALYGPLLYRYARLCGLVRTDAEEVRDRCLAILVQQMPDFDYQPGKGRFKAWLRRIVTNKVVDLLRKARERQADSAVMAEVDNGDPTPLEVWERNWRTEHLKYCVEQLRTRYKAENVRAFEMLLFEGASVEQVCDELGLGRDGVYKAKSRILQAVREMMAQFDAELE